MLPCKWDYQAHLWYLPKHVSKSPYESPPPVVGFCSLGKPGEIYPVDSFLRSSLPSLCSLGTPGQTGEWARCWKLKHGNKHEKLLEQSVSANPNLCIHQILFCSEFLKTYTTVHLTLSRRDSLKQVLLKPARWFNSWSFHPLVG